MSRLIVVSNRVSAPETPGAASFGGLTMALSDALANSGGLWFGWSGRTALRCDPHPRIENRGGVAVATLDLDAADVAAYYNGFANAVLWPLFHHRSDLARYERSFVDGYQRVNERFADAIAHIARPDDVIWIHDYHLIPLGKALRRRGLQNRIGFFLHVPWPARELLTTLPRHGELVSALFAYDLIGFQSEDWLRAFKDYVLTEAGGTAGDDGALTAFGQATRAGVFPIGIDCESFKRLAASREAAVSYMRASATSAFRALVIAVDRVDYSKGLEQRFDAFERLLETYPDLIEQVHLLQIGQPSRVGVNAYEDIAKRLEAVSGRINGRYATVDWTPVRYLNRSFTRDHIAGLYRAARVGLVTPLRDGMNLVAKEYVAAQDPTDPGVLVLSRFAGAAAQMKEAIIVNPHSPDDVADAIRQALAMPKAERISRWTELMRGVEQENAETWRRDFLAALNDRETLQTSADITLAPLEGVAA